MRHEAPYGDLRERTVVVTGGNGGIGLGLAVGVGRAGAEVASWGRSEAKNRVAVESLEEMGIVAHAIVCDVSNESSVVDAMTATLSPLSFASCAPISSFTTTCAGCGR